jgi:hypothetical protein
VPNLVTPAELYTICSPLTAEDTIRSHYLQNALRYSITNYRRVSLGDIVSHGMLQRIPESLLKFINRYGEVLVIAHVLAADVYSLTFRAIESKDFTTYGSQSFFYGSGDLANTAFIYGDPIVLVEGILDRDALNGVYPYIMSTLSSSMSLVQLEILEVLTNNVILMYDNDVRGQDGVLRDIGKLKPWGIEVFTINHPGGVKDSGTLAEYHFQGELSKEEELRNYYLKNIEDICKRV